MATLIKADGTTREVYPKSGLSFTLNEMQQHVGGTVEAVYPKGDDVLLCNENAKPLRMPVNFTATEKYSDSLLAGDYLAGDVLVCTGAEAGDDEDDPYSEEKEHDTNP